MIHLRKVAASESKLKVNNVSRSICFSIVWLTFVSSRPHGALIPQTHQIPSEIG